MGVAGGARCRDHTQMRSDGEKKSLIVGVERKLFTASACRVGPGNARGAAKAKTWKDRDALNSALGEAIAS